MSEIRTAEIAEIAGVTAKIVHHWKTRYDDFPEPIRTTPDNREWAVYDRDEMLAWLASYSERRVAKAKAALDRAVSAVATAETSLEAAQRLYDRLH